MSYTRRFIGAGGSGGGSGTVTATGSLTANHVVVGNGGVDEKVLASLGTTTTVLHGNAAGLPTFAAVNLASGGDVTGILPAANLSNVLNKQYATATLTGDSTDQTILTYTIPGGTIPINGGVRVTLVSVQAGTTSTLYKLFFGGTNMVQQAAVTSATAYRLQAVILNGGATNVQTPWALGANGAGIGGYTFADAAIDTTSPAIIKWTFNVANTVTITKYWWLVELLQ